MTEQEWLTATDLPGMVTCLRNDHRYNRTKSGRRRLRLFLCGCCRAVWPLIEGHDLSRERVEIAERFADAEASQMELDAICYCAHRSSIGDAEPGTPAAYARSATHAVCASTLQCCVESTGRVVASHLA